MKCAVLARENLLADCREGDPRRLGVAGDPAEVSVPYRFDRGVRNVERVVSGRNRDTPRKLLSFMLIARVEHCGECAKYVSLQWDVASGLR